MTLDTWFDQTVQKMDGSRRQGYMNVYRGTWEKPLGKKRLKNLTPRQIQQVVDARLAAGRAAKTVRNDVSVLAVLLDEAVRAGEVRWNAARAVAVPPAAPARAAAAMPAEQKRQIVAAAKKSQHPYAPGVVLACQLELTGAEVCALQFGDVGAEMVTIRRRLCRAESGWRAETIPPRSIRLQPRSRAVLDGQRARFCCVMGRQPEQNDPVLFRPEGAPVNPDNLRQFLSRLAAGCGAECAGMDRLAKRTKP